MNTNDEHALMFQDDMDSMRQSVDSVEYSIQSITEAKLKVYSIDPVPI